MKIGLLFGSFDPIHNGHTAIAHWALGGAGGGGKVTEEDEEKWLCEKVLFVLSPQNPLKSKTRAIFEQRAQMIKMAIDGHPKMELCTIETQLTPPYYTINTIEKLTAENPSNHYTILCGTDVIESSHKWHRAEELHKLVSFTAYPRGHEGGQERGHEKGNEKYKKLPLFDISSTEIRLGEKLNHLNPKVKEYIETQKIYNTDLEKGYKHYDCGEFGPAINHWQKCQNTPQWDEAKTLIEMAQNILAYRYTDILNP